LLAAAQLAVTTHVGGEWLEDFADWPDIKAASIIRAGICTWIWNRIFLFNRSVTTELWICNHLTVAHRLKSLLLSLSSHRLGSWQTATYEALSTNSWFIKGGEGSQTSVCRAMQFPDT